MRTLVLTVIGDDQPGLVGAIASAVAQHDASWEQSHMARMKGKFAGIVVVECADEATSRLIADLDRIEQNGLLDIAVETVSTAAETGLVGEVVELELLGPDQPGIVNEIAGTLAENGVSIVEIETEVRDAPMGGGQLFEAQLSVLLPSDVETGLLRDALEEVAAGLMVELTFG